MLFGIANHFIEAGLTKYYIDNTLMDLGLYVVYRCNCRLLHLKKECMD